MAAPILIGDPFQRRIRRSSRRGENRLFARYRCECGTEFEAAVVNIETGKTTSCGCKSSKRAIGDRSRKHGMSGTRTYEIWCGMRKRCNDPKSNKYHLYGGRGIRVCDRWNNFQNFLADMGEAPMGKSIDRQDSDGDYQPGNCRWATPQEQARNMRTVKMLTIRGETKPLWQWAEDVGLTRLRVHDRLAKGWTPEEAVFGRSGK